ncbi:MAG: GntR family transcriptional regulator, partial [Mesorhizobium sp.]
VAPLHPGDWLRVIDARRGIEVVLARSAARFVTREAADLFHEAALAMQKAVISGNVLSFIQADKQLDEALAILDGDEEAAAKDAKKLMALLRHHAEAAATR